jgi:hypothetical protein
MYIIYTFIFRENSLQKKKKNNNYVFKYDIIYLQIKLEFITVLHGGIMILKRVFAVFLCSVLLICTTGCVEKMADSISAAGDEVTSEAETAGDSTTKAETTAAETTTVATTTATKLEEITPIIIKNNTVLSDYYIDKDGNVKAFGSNDVLMSDVRSIHNTGYLSGTYFFIKNNNELWGYGEKGSGELGDDTGMDKDNINDSVKILDDVANLYIVQNASGATIFAIKTDYTAWVWGDFYEYDLFSDDKLYVPKQIKIQNDKFVSIEAEGLPLSSNGTVYSLAYFDSYNHKSKINIPFPIDNNFSEFINIDIYGSSPDHYGIDKQKAVYKYEYYLDYTGAKNSGKVVVDKTLLMKNAKSIQPASDTTNTGVFIIDEDNVLWGYGDNTQGELGDGSLINRDTPKKIADNVKSVSYYAYVTTNNEFWVWSNEDPKPKKYMNDVEYCYLAGARARPKIIKTDGTIVDENGKILAENVMLPTEGEFGSTGTIATAAGSASSGKTTLNIYAYSNEVPGFFEKYFEVYPERKKLYDLNITVLSTASGVINPYETIK